MSCATRRTGRRRDARRHRPPHRRRRTRRPRGERLVLAGARIVGALTGARPAPRPGTRVWFVTSGAAAVAERRAARPGAAALRGLVRVLAFEHPELAPKWVDLDPTAASTASPRAGRDRRRGRGRLARGARATSPAWSARAPRERPGAVRPVVADDGAYLITGGLGGLGLLLARWLAAGRRRPRRPQRPLGPRPAARRELAMIESSAARSS